MIKSNKQAKQKMLAGLAIVVVVLLVVSGVYVYNEYYTDDEDVVEEEPVKVIDDRISPLENQGVIIEVNRLRHRGLYERLKTFGSSWRNKPTFFFKTNMDGLEYSSNVVGQHGRFEEINYNTWDTMFMESKIVKDVQEEQETSEITLTIVEIVKTGLFKRKTKEVERDSFSVTYDFRTGRWHGDDNFDDEDGYGYYLGDTFEIWFNVYQVDSDFDGIPYWTEVNVLGTDPKRSDLESDPDGDGCSTVWEWRWGYDPFTWDDHEKLDPDVDGLENTEECYMEKWFANPFAQDVYLEIDVLDRENIFDAIPYIPEESLQAIIEAFSKHNIRLFFDDSGWPNGPTHGGGDVMPYNKKLSQDSGMILRYYNNYFSEERRGIFRYVIIGHGGGFNHPAKYNVYDTIFIARDPQLMFKPYKAIKNLVTLGVVPTPRGLRCATAGGLMHEIGHSVGIGVQPFEGVDNYTYASYWFPKESYKYSAYHSVMNYLYTHRLDLIDFSDGSNGPPYDQNDWEKIFVPGFQQNDPLIEEPFFEPPARPDQIVMDEVDFYITGYVRDDELTKQIQEEMGEYSPVDPIKVDWLAFKLEDKDKYPDYRDIKILVKPLVPEGIWIEYTEGNLDSNGEIQFYSQQALIDEALELIE